MFSWEVTALRLDEKAGGKPCKYRIYVRRWDNTIIKFEQVFNSHTEFYAWVGGMYCNSLEKIERIDYSREVLNT